MTTISQGPFSKLEKLEVTHLDPSFKKYEILVAPNDRIMVVLETCNDWPSEFSYEGSGKHMITVTWKLNNPVNG
jgi:hypothetical protein